MYINPMTALLYYNDVSLITKIKKEGDPKVKYQGAPSFSFIFLTPVQEEVICILRSIGGTGSAATA
jgi:hypothetical protein